MAADEPEAPLRPDAITFIALKNYLRNLHTQENKLKSTKLYEYMEKKGRLGMITTIYEAVKEWEEGQNEPS